MGEQQNPGKKNKIPAPPGSQASPKILKRKKNHYTTNPPACPPPPRGQQPKKPWHKAFAQGISISTPKRSALAPKKPCLTKNPKPKPRKKMPVSKAKTGKPPPEFGFAEFFSFCTRLLVKQEFSDAKAETGKLSQNSASPNSLAFAHGCW